MRRDRRPSAMTVRTSTTSNAPMTTGTSRITTPLPPSRSPAPDRSTARRARAARHLRIAFTTASHRRPRLVIDGGRRAEGGPQVRRGWTIALAIVGVLVVVGVAFGAWNAGVDEGIRRGAEAGQVVEVVGRGYGHGGWGFPFGLILF